MFEMTSENDLKLAFIRLYQKGNASEAAFPAKNQVGYTLKRRVETPASSPFTSSKRSKADLSPPRPVSIPTLPSTKSLRPRKTPVTSSVPADTSYSSLLSDCVVTSLTSDLHIQRLCECLGACYLDHIADITTHIVFSRELDLGEKVTAGKDAKIVTVEWLERCLEEKKRQNEEEFLIL